MSEIIPQDIREKAENVFEYWMKTADTVIADLIAIAILAHEREVLERCAKIAEETAPEHPHDDYDVGALDRAVWIAAAIRETVR